MRVLLKRILQLPDLALKTKQWNELIDIINYFNISYSDDFLATIKENFTEGIHTIFSANCLNRIAHYLNQWHEVFSLAMTYNVLMVEKWREINGNEIANDELLPLTIELIDIDLPSLKIIHQKLSRAVQLFNTGEQGYTLINLYSAVEAKINGASIEHEMDDNKKRQILEVKNDFILQDHIEKILLICTKYKCTLFASFRNRINFLGFDRCFNDPSLTNDTPLHEVLALCISHRNLAHIVQDPYLLSIINKYIVIEDIHLSFNHQEYSPYFLNELSEKIRQHQPTLQTMLYQNDYWSLLKCGYAGYRYIQKVNTFSAKETKLYNKLSFFAQTIPPSDINLEFVFEKRPDI